MRYIGPQGSEKEIPHTHTHTLHNTQYTIHSTICRRKTNLDLAFGFWRLFLRSGTYIYVCVYQHGSSQPSLLLGLVGCRPTAERSTAGKQAKRDEQRPGKVRMAAFEGINP